MRDVVAAFIEALEAQNLKVHAGMAPNNAKAPYVVVYVPRPRPADRSVAAKHAAASWRIATLYVGTSHDSVLWVAEKANTALLDQRLTITGKACSPMVSESGRPAGPDPDDKAIFSATDVWTFHTSSVPVPPPPPED